MKTLKLIVLVVTISLFASCKSDDNGNNDANQFANIVTDIQGNWEITLFSEDDVDQTSNFQSMEFEFKADGTVVASNDLLSEVGTWSYQETSSNSSDEKLQLQFPVGGLFEELTDDWHITSASTTSIVLFDISGNGTTDLLTFASLQ
ncbi:hypothetical protein [Ulvibacter antarcticus]|uniref:Lipocalin-like protein n=1 Tax=Ulvibacter antarcticus TaxID=442714 RepID=A0A3L9YW63_9FLAO|nr:hypothetical protein [Ulvibacter antarcticus]RMA64753.1 hypothetical protein BXY75_1634 [Ulvibacter antarcticus]